MAIINLIKNNEGVDVSEATITPEDIVTGYTSYDSTGTKIVGTGGEYVRNITIDGEEYMLIE